LVVPGGVDRSGVDHVIPALLALVERLARRHDVHVFATRQEPTPGDWPLLGARVHNIGMARGTTRRLSSRFGALHAREPFDLIHAFFGWAGAAAVVVGRRHRVPVLFHAAGGEFVGLRDIGYGMRCSFRDSIAARIATRGARRVTVATRYMQTLAAQFGVAADVVALGVDRDRWPAAAPRARERSAPLRLLHVGDVRPVKNQRMLMASVDRLLDAGLDIQLDAVGLHTADALPHIPEAQRLGARFTAHGVLRHSELRALVDRSDLLLVTSHHEAGPLVVLEAAMAGVPTVGTHVGHVADWALDAAVSVPVSDFTAMAREILALAADEPRRIAIAAEAQRKALAIDADDTAAAFEHIYSMMTTRERPAIDRDRLPVNGA
ncbi:MAG TPA: glycosyltransferase family 4 protein, partial [Gemmatimonadaceae bacterium]|nr:glycosyltransferase family 4 protein [Gemmatimonadaceae bacterium]